MNVGIIIRMVAMDELAETAYKDGVASLRAGITPELPGVDKLSAGYWAMVAFLEARGAMLVGDLADPSRVVKHLELEQKEAEDDITNREKLKTELGDTAFISLVIGGLLWNLLKTPQQRRTREILVWSKETAHEYHIDLDKATVCVATSKNPENYPKEELQLFLGDTVADVVSRLPGIYGRLRSMRAEQKYVLGDVRYSHTRASQFDHVRAGGRYDT